MSPHLSQRIRKIFRKREFLKGSLLLREGEKSDPVLFVVSGLLRCYQIEQTRELSKCFLRRNELLITGIGTPADGRSTGFIEALTDSKVMLCPRHELEHVYKDYPEFEHHGRVLTLRSYRQMYMVLDTIRSLPAKERYWFLQREFPHLVLSVPLKYLASYLGINQVTLSRIRKVR